MFTFVEKTISNSPNTWQSSFWEVINSCFIRMCKFASFKNPFSMIIDLFEFYFRIKRFILYKKVISMSYGSNTTSWKPWHKWDLTWYLQWGIYTSIATSTHSQNSLAAAEAPSLKTSSDGKFLKRSERPSQSAH